MRGGSIFGRSMDGVMPGANRDFEQRERHLEVIERSLLDGMTDRQVVAAAAEAFKIDAKTARRDIALVRKRWLSRGAKRNTQAEFEKAVARCEVKNLRAMKVADKASRLPDDEGLNLELGALSTAQRFEQDRCKLLSLYPADTLTIKDERAKAAADLSDDELARIATEEGGRAATSTNDGDGTRGGGGTPEAAGGPLRAAGLHDVHDAHLLGELAPPADRRETGPLGEQGVSAAAGPDLRPQPGHPCD